MTSTLETNAELTDILDDDFEQAFADVRELLGSAGVARCPNTGQPASLRWDVPVHEAGPGETSVDIATSGNKRVRQHCAPNSDHTVGSLSWGLLVSGLAVFVCGASLIGLALLASRPLLWQIGLPLMLGGQVAVLVFVIAQLEAFWKSERQIGDALQQVREQLRQFHQEWDQRAEKVDRQQASPRQDSAGPRPPHIRVGAGRQQQTRVGEDATPPSAAVLSR